MDINWSRTRTKRIASNTEPELGSLAEEREPERESEQLSDREYWQQEKEKAIWNLLIFFAAVVIVAIAVGTAAWFASNREVSGNNMAVVAADLPFEIATKGSDIRNASEWNSLLPATEYVDGVEAILFDTNNDSGNYRTSEMVGSIKLRYDPQNAGINGQTAVAPGSSGELSLYVIPKTDEELSVRIRLNVAAYAERIVTEGENEDRVAKVIRITDAETLRQADPEMEEDEVNDYLAAAAFLKGHVLFFGGSGDVVNEDKSKRYLFHTPYADGVIEQTIPAGNNGKAVQVPIFWAWSNTLGQIILPDNVSHKRNGYPIVADLDANGAANSEKSELAGYLKDHKTEIFNNPDNIEGAVIDQYIDTLAGVYDAEQFETPFRVLSQGYNQADFEIGKNVACFLIEVSVEEAE